MTSDPLNLELPVRIGGRVYPTMEHYVLSSLLKDKVAQGVLVSYSKDKIQEIFNYYDQQQYERVVYDACNRFNEKKCRSVQRQGSKTIGALSRELIKTQPDFVCMDDGPFRTMVGVIDLGGVLHGYNIMGHSLLRMKYVLSKLPELGDPVSEYIFWKTHPEEIPDFQPKTYKAILKKPTMKEIVQEAKEESEMVGAFYEAEEPDDDEEVEVEEPVYTDHNRVRWVSTVGARSSELMYATEAKPINPFQLSSETDLYSRTEPFFIYKTHKATEYLVESMKNGIDIQSFLHKPVDSIIAECQIPLDQKRSVHKECWDKFMTKTIPYYSFIEKEILYPQNLAGFIRKEYGTHLNGYIGQKVREVLFASFLFQVMERSYPQVAPELRIIIMNREMKKFSPQEYQEITDKLYRLFFEGKFRMDQEGVRRLTLLESYRLTPDEVEEAIRFVPIKFVAMPYLDIGKTILDPMAQVDIVMDGNVFHDLYQFIYYKLFVFYGATDPYRLLFKNNKMMSGNDPALGEVLVDLIQSRKYEFERRVLLAVYEQYPHVQEAVLYFRTEKKILDNFLDDIELDPMRLRMMKWVASMIPRDPLHQERSIYLYFFLLDMVRSLGIMKSILGKRVQGKSLKAFVHCFYRKLEMLRLGVRSTTPPAQFVSLMEDTKTITTASIQELWRFLYPFFHLFQQEKFVPSRLFKEAKEKYASVVDEEKYIKALSGIVRCLYEDKEVPNDHFYLLTQIISGKDDIPIWPDPSFEMIKDVEEEEGVVAKQVRKFVRRKSKKPKLEAVRYDILHPLFLAKQQELDQAFGKNAARASYALASLMKETIHPRRIVFFDHDTI